MEHEQTEAGRNSGETERIGFFKRFARNVFDRLGIFKPHYPNELTNEDDRTSADTEPEVDESEQPDPSITVSLDQQGSFYIEGEGSQAVGPLTTHYNSSKLFRELAAMYIPLGAGEYSPDDIAAHTNYKPTTITKVAERLTDFLPIEVISVDGTAAKDRKIRFGNLALVSMLDQTVLEQSLYRQTPEQIDRGKIDLTTQTHAIINVRGHEEESFYLPLHTPAAIMAARVIESIKHLRTSGAKKVHSSDVAEQAWHSMTLAERQTFIDDDEVALLSNASPEIEVPVIRILRRLTNKLMLTHEPRNDRFTLLDAELAIQYSDQPLSESQIKLDKLRPIAPPEQTAGEPDLEKQAEYMDLARAYMRQAKSRASVADQDALDMLDFLMSPNGHWAVKAVAGEKGLFKTHNGAMYVMHIYLRSQFPAYGPAYRNRLISGNRRLRNRQRGGVRQVSGAIPKDSNWSLGEGMQEFFGGAKAPTDEA